jgi:hypothetical protein
MQPVARGIVASSMGLVAVAALIGTTLGSTGSAPRDAVPPPPPSGPEPWLAFPIAILGLVTLAVVLLILRPGSRRPIAAIAMLVASAWFGLLGILVGLFSDFSGRHEIAWPWLIGGCLVLAFGLLGSFRVLRGRSVRASDAA